MADEAAVENLPVNRFFCHKCSREIPVVLPDYRCPTCMCGFIEALDSDDDSDDDSDIGFRPYDLLENLLQTVQNMSEDESGSQRRSNNVSQNRLHRSNTVIENRPGRTSNVPDDRSPRTNNVADDRIFLRSGGRRRSGRSGRGRHGAQLEHVIQDFIVNLTGVGFGRHVVGQRGEHNPTPVLFLGNPGDYAWGREGLDAIVTQLLNQMDSTGPPPLAREKINEIPSVKITQEQIDTSLQCSVCWEDFAIEELVRKLACEHLYHENCIVPWLELHGTCPICRKALSEEVAAENSENANNPIGNQLATLFRVANHSVRDTEAPSTSNSSGSETSSSTPSSSASSRRDLHMEMDFD